MLVALLACFACSDRATADGAPPFPDVEPAEDLGAVAESIPEPAPSIVAVDRVAVEDPEAPSPLELLDADAIPAGVIRTEDVLISEVLRGLPLEQQVLAEVIVKETVTLLAQNGRLNPGEGQFTGRTEKIIALVIGALILVARMFIPAPARIERKQEAGIRAELDEIQADVQAIKSGVSPAPDAAVSQALAAQLADARLQLQEQAREIVLMREAQRRAGEAEKDARVARRPLGGLGDEALVASLEARGAQALR